METQPQAGPSDYRESSLSETGNGVTHFKRRLPRGRMACFQCRTAKTKCGGSPPDTCQNCLELGRSCQWPAEDGRTSKARASRSQSKPASGVKMEDDLLVTSTASDDWLDQILGRTNGGSGASPPVAAGQWTNTAGPPRLDSFAGPSSWSAPPDPPRGSRGFSLADLTSFSPMPNIPYAPSPNFDPNQLIWALSSQLPTIEEGDSIDDRSASGFHPRQASSTSPENMDGPRNDGKIYKVTWYRPHGKTAIAPGLKKITLKVRVDNPQNTWRPSPADSSASPGIVEELISADGMPTTPVMLHLLDVFMTHFGCQFPFIDREVTRQQIETRTGSTFLLLAIAGMAARFSTHPAIARPGMEPYAYGNVFYDRALALLGGMLAVPSRETVTALVLLGHVAFAEDSESSIWQLVGMAVRMSFELPIPTDPGPDSSISPEDRRLNRLVFWSVLLMDFALAHGVGRRIGFALEDISQALPTDEDIHPNGIPPGTPRSPFPYAAKMMLLYGPIINMLNRPSKGPATSDADLQAARAEAVKEYNQLPPDMQWNVANLQAHSRANQGSIFVHLHLWIHTILATAYLTGTDMRRKPHPDGMTSGIATPLSSAATSMWRNSARIIGEILLISDITNPYSFYALPFVNQAFFVAGCCYVKELEMYRTPNPSRPSSPPPGKKGEAKPTDFSRALLQSVAASNISTLQQGLAKQAKWWRGVEWVAAALAQRVEGVQDIDLVKVTERLASSVSLPDAGLIPKASRGEEDSSTPGLDSLAAAAIGRDAAPQAGFSFSRELLCVLRADAAFDMSSMFDLGGSSSMPSSSIVEQDLVIPPSVNWDWFKQGYANGGSL